MKWLILVMMTLLYGCGNQSVTPVRPDQSVNRMIVRFTAGPGKSVGKSLGMPVENEFQHLGMATVIVPNGMTEDDVRATYGSSVDIVEKDSAISMNSLTPNDQFFASYEWDMLKINMPSAWTITQGSAGIIVGVVDTGINAAHPDLVSNWSGYWFDAVSGKVTPYDDNGHGTHVSGTIGAKGNNGIGVAGVSWNSKIASCKAFDAAGNGTTSAAIACINYFYSLRANGVNIVAVNESWGNTVYSAAMASAIAAGPTILHVAAAGNSSANNDISPNYPASLPYPNVISVAATNSADGLSYYSNYGSRTTVIGAPGDSILSTYGTGYLALSGTSMATPHVTGAIAEVAASNPTMTSDAIRNVILSSGDTQLGLSNTVTGKRLNVATALACNNKPLIAVKSIDNNNYQVISVNCSTPIGPVTMKTPKGTSTLANSSGIVTFSYTPTGTETLTFSSTTGTTSINVSVPTLSVSMPKLTVGTSVSIPLVATGGTAPYTFSGVIPPGMSILGSVLGGAPTVVGTTSGSLTVTDAKGMTYTLQESYVVNAKVAPLVSSVPALIPCTKGVTLSYQLVVTGGTQPYAFTGTVPTGMSLSSSGLLAGKPSSTALTFSPVKVTDASGQILSISIGLMPTLDAPLNNFSLPAFKVGVAVSIQVVADNLTGPYVYSGMLPPGLVISTTGLITGKPTTVGTGNAIITTIDSNKDTVMKVLSYSVSK